MKNNFSTVNVISIIFIVHVMQFSDQRIVVKHWVSVTLVRTA